MRSRIRISLLLTVTIAILSAATVLASISFAQQQPAAAAQPSSPEIQAVLEKVVHLKKVNVGDPVTARVTEATKLRDGTEIPKGSHVIGKVTEVKSKPDAEGPARLGLFFDQVQLKDGKQVPVAVALMSVAPPWQPGGSSLGAADNKMSGAARTQNMSGGSASDPASANSNLARGDLGIRSASANAGPGAMQPGVSYLENVALVSYSMGEPGTVLESKKGTFYIDSGCRLLFMGK